MATSAKMDNKPMCLVCGKDDPMPENHVLHDTELHDDKLPRTIWYGGISWHSKCFDVSRQLGKTKRAKEFPWIILDQDGIVDRVATEAEAVQYIASMPNEDLRCEYDLSNEDS